MLQFLFRITAKNWSTFCQRKEQKIYCTNMTWRAKSERLRYKYIINDYDVSVRPSVRPSLSKIVLRRIVDAKLKYFFESDPFRTVPTEIIPCELAKREKRMTPHNISFTPSTPEGMKRTYRTLRKIIIFLPHLRNSLRRGEILPGAAIHYLLFTTLFSCHKNNKRASTGSGWPPARRSPTRLVNIKHLHG